MLFRSVAAHKFGEFVPQCDGEGVFVAGDFQAAAEGVAELVEVFDFRVQLCQQRRDLFLMFILNF